MNKYLVLLMSCLTLVMGSCSNESIEIEEEYRYDVVVNVNTTKTYELCGERQLLNMMGDDKDMFVGATSLLYDAQGKLVDKVSTTARSFAQQSQTLSNVSEGSYTLVSVVTFVYESEDFSALSIKISGEEKLSTLMLLNSDESYLYWYEVCGVDVQKISVRKNTSITMAPAMVGAFINFNYSNFKTSGFDWLGFCVKNRVGGYYLDPSLSERDRLYYEDPNANKTWTALGRFYPKTELTDSEEQGGQTIYSFNLGSQNYCFAPSTVASDGSIRFTTYPSSNSYFTFENGVEYNAYAYYTGGAPKVETYLGDEDGFESWYNKLTQVNAFAFGTPYINWSGKVKNVKSYMSGYTLTDEGTNEGGDYALYYDGKDSELQYRYFFPSASSNLYEVDVLFDASEVSITQIKNAVEKEGYIFISDSEGIIMYMSSDATTVVGILESDDIRVLAYIDMAYLQGMSYARERLQQKARKRSLQKREESFLIFDNTSDKYKKRAQKQL